MAERTSGSAQNLQADVSTAELAIMLDSMRKEFAGQRTAFETKIAELENQIASLQPAKSAPAKTEPMQPTSRRRVLKKLVVGAAGAATLGLAANTTIPQAQAGTNSFDFNGNSSGTGQNIASGPTFISASGNNVSPVYPLLTLNNTTTATNIVADPTQESIGLYAQSSDSFAIYGAVNGGGRTPTAIIGVSGTDPSSQTQGGGNFFAGEYGGVVGASLSNKGVVGLTGNNSAVEGLSLNGAGVRGVSNAAIGGQFGVNPVGGDATQGAALMIAPRKNVPAIPTNNALSHSAGEMHVDKYGRLWICQAGYRPGAGLEPTVTSSDIFDQGLLNKATPTGPGKASWMQVAGVVSKTYNPNTTDLDYYSSGTFWVNTTTGETFLAGANNNSAGSMVDRDGAALPHLTWTQIGTPATSAIHYLTLPVRYADTRDNTGVYTRFADNDTKVFPIAGYSLVANGKAKQVYVPAGAIGILGNITIVDPTIPGTVKGVTDGNGVTNPAAVIGSKSGFATVWGGGTRPVPSNINYFVGGQNTANFFTSKLSSTGGLTVFCLRSANVIIDVVAYFGPNLPAGA